MAWESEDDDADDDDDDDFDEDPPLETRLESPEFPSFRVEPAALWWWW